MKWCRYNGGCMANVPTELVELSQSILTIVGDSIDKCIEVQNQEIHRLTELHKAKWFDAPLIYSRSTPLSNMLKDNVEINNFRKKLKAINHDMVQHMDGDELQAMKKDLTKSCLSSCKRMQDFSNHPHFSELDPSAKKIISDLKDKLEKVREKLQPETESTLRGKISPQSS